VRTALRATLCLGLLATAVSLSGCAGPARRDFSATAAPDEGHSAGHVALYYIPNRVFDLLDIVRARLRLGPGLAFDARATEFADFFVGAYSSVWMGLPGPREAPVINWPFGLESRAGAEVSVVDATAEGGVNYGFLEVGLGGQLVIIGVDVGVDVWEALDFITGLVTIDPGHDDL
jgi:hypothetical protein